MKKWIKCSLREAGWAPALVLVLSLIFGNVFHAYERFPGLDKAVHLIGGMAIAYFFATSIRYSQGLTGKIGSKLQLVLVLALTLVVAFAWEGIELLGDASLNMKMNHGLTDTLLDIVFGLLGALIVLVFSAGGRPKGSRPPENI